MACVFDDVITRNSAPLSVSESLAMTNKSMSAAQSDRRFKGGVPLSFEPPTSLFPNKDSVTSALWK
eukprot:CAMPEP_0173464866 /NCGR_PEP_ID=MMETSP1357-20121228/70677_1 /TAXON_ID=77926 /ORGANISM="Hemiselmis rufescens, Strain PCC563" /LENGTH=65 /DNA_ID=CAMNT_0014432801 /DNA_START=12 /DNA_END=209 /DNA_ORIENTATION=+